MGAKFNLKKRGLRTSLEFWVHSTNFSLFGFLKMMMNKKKVRENEYVLTGSMTQFQENLWLEWRSIVEPEEENRDPK